MLPHTWSRPSFRHSPGRCRIRQGWKHYPRPSLISMQRNVEHHLIALVLGISPTSGKGHPLVWELSRLRSAAVLLRHQGHLVHVSHPLILAQRTISVHGTTQHSGTGQRRSQLEQGSDRSISFLCNVINHNSST